MSIQRVLSHVYIKNNFEHIGHQKAKNRIRYLFCVKHNKKCTNKIHRQTSWNIIQKKL